MRIEVFRKEHFNAAHRLFHPDRSDEENSQTFGKCFSPNYHGHNYELVVGLKGDIDPETGYVYDMKKLSELIRKYIVAKFDHRNLNLDVEELKGVIPSAENIVVKIWNILRDQIPAQYDLQITLYETERNFVRYPA